MEHLKGLVSAGLGGGFEAHLGLGITILFTLGSVTGAKLHLGSSNKIVLWLGVTTMGGTVAKGHSLRKIENRCLTLMEILFTHGFITKQPLLPVPNDM